MGSSFISSIHQKADDPVISCNNMSVKGVVTQ